MKTAEPPQAPEGLDDAVLSEMRYHASYAFTPKTAFVKDYSAQFIQDLIEQQDAGVRAIYQSYWRGLQAFYECGRDTQRS